MERKRYSKEFKDQVLKECYEVGNIALVSRRYEISENTVQGWVKEDRKKQQSITKDISFNNLPKEVKDKLKELEGLVSKLSKENTTCKRLIADKELEIAVLKDLHDLVNPK